MTDPRLELWHKIVFEKDFNALSALLADNVEFHSPVVWKPKQGRHVTHFILQSVLSIFQDFTYRREWIDGNDFALEFSASVGDKMVKGIDLIRLNDEGQIVHFEVMLRPANGAKLLGEKMTDKLQKAGFTSSDLAS